MSTAIFLILWAMQCRPHSILTFSNPFSRNLRMPKLPLISPKTLSTSTGRRLLILRPSSEQRFFLACSFKTFNFRLILIIRLAKGSSDFTHLAR